MTPALDQFERQLVAASRALAVDASPRSSAFTQRTRPDEGPYRSGRLRQKRRLLVAIVAVLVALGGVAAASSVLWPAQRLADGKVNCFMATHGTGALDLQTLAVGGARANGQPPIGLCRMWYRINRYRLNGSTTGPKVAGLPLIACQESRTLVGVYVSDGKPRQCQRLGERPLPATYAAAAARLRDLQHSLLVAQHQHDCVSVTAIATTARDILQSEGFTHWRVITPPARDPGKRWIFGYALPAGTGGRCGTVLASNYPPSSVINIDTQRQTITVSIGPPLSIGKAINHIMYRLNLDTSLRCYTPATFRTLARQAFAHTPLAPRTALVAGQQGVQYEPALAERLYQRGCVRPYLAIPGDDDTFIDIIVNALHAPRLPNGVVYPPAGAFH